MSLNHDLDEILDVSLDSIWSVSYGSSPPLDDQGSRSEADPYIPICQYCDCEKCRKLQEHAKRKRGKRASLETVARLFPRPDLINILDKYWEILKVYGLFIDQLYKPFQWSNTINSPVYIQYCEYYLILRRLETDNGL
jgi:hypothetical protein